MDSQRWTNARRVRNDYTSRSPSVTGRPLEAFLEVSARCNLSCRMCAIAHDTRYRADTGRPAVMTPDVFARLRPVFPTLLRAYLYGLGEPLLNPHLVDFITELARAGVEPCFTTNATLIDKRKAEELARAGVERVSVSIDGASRRTYEFVRRGGRWQDLVRGLHALVRARERHGRPWLTVNFVAMATNIHELQDLVTMLADLGIGELNVEPLFAWDSCSELQTQYDEDSLGTLDRDQVLSIMHDAHAMAVEAGLHFTSFFLTSNGSMDYRARVSEEGHSYRVACSEPWTTIFVTTAGEVRPCCLNDTVFGLLGDTDVRRIWNGGTWADFRRQHRHEEPVPTGCGSCMSNGRQRISPMVAAVEPVSFRPYLAAPPPRRERSSWVIDGLHDGMTVTDPILITGRAPRFLCRVPLSLRWRLMPEVVIDHVSVGTLSDAVFDGDEFALILHVPYLSEGDHVLSLRVAGETGPGWGRRSISFWRPLEQGETITAGSTLAVGQELLFRAREVEVTIDGNTWTSPRWYCSRDRAGWRGVSVIDVGTLDLGRHRLTLHVEGHCPSDHVFWRVRA